MRKRPSFYRSLVACVAAPVANKRAELRPALKLVMSENKICLRLLGLSLAPQPGVTQCYIAKNRPLTLA
jgi:hypothetical protein